jgi:hypothetical protein
VEADVLTVGIHPENYETVTEGIIVNVAGNGDVEIERWDTYRNEEIRPRWLVEAPHDGSKFTYKNRNGLPAPSFPRGARPTVKNIADGSVTVSFPQATDNEVVHHYRIEIRDGEQMIASHSEFSQYYLNSQMPKHFAVNFSGLPQDKKLVAQVTAVDSYNNQSVLIVSKAFKTAK